MDTVAKNPTKNSSASGTAFTNSAPYSPPALSALEQRRQHIEEAAYFKAQSRGFAPGHEMQDWLEAEAEVDAAARPLGA
jgi:hypothetical protein